MSSIEDGAVAAVTRLAESCAGILQASLVSAILHGSLTMNDFRPGSSDLELLLVVDPCLTSSDADALIQAVRAAHLGPAGRVDLLVVTPDDHVPDLWPELSDARERALSSGARAA